MALPPRADSVLAMPSFKPDAAGPWRARAINSARGDVCANAADEVSSNRTSFFIFGNQYTGFRRERKTARHATYGSLMRSIESFCSPRGAASAILAVMLVPTSRMDRSEEHTSELQSRQYLVCR